MLFIRYIWTSPLKKESPYKLSLIILVTNGRYSAIFMGMKRVIILILAIVPVITVTAQQEMLAPSSLERRAKIIGALPQDPEKEEAVAFAGRYGIPVREVDRTGRVREISRIVKGRIPLYLTTHNIDAAISVSTDRVWNGAIEGLNLRGRNILVGVWDGGRIRTTHSEFGSRVYSLDSGFEIVGHATHVAGTIGAAGLEPDATGMASQSFIEGYDWDNDNQEMRQAGEEGLLLSNHSYGFIHGFDFNISEGRWEWYGDVDISEEEDYKFGFYGIDARAWDGIAYDHPYYLIVKSAGNDRLEGPGAGAEHYVWDNGWKASNKVRSKDGGPDGWDGIGTQSTSKNILTVGAVRDVEGGYQGPGDVVMTDFSTFGPTDDGRIKPDIVGNGQTLFSAYYNSDNDYETLSGTSMAAPNVTGSLALLQELHMKKFSRFMKSATLKGLILHTADDAGNPGPDYRFGWGLLNTYRAARFISREELLIREESLAEQATARHSFFASGDSAIRVTLCWTDPQGPVVTRALDPKDTVLVNDLDIRLVRRATGDVSQPFTLDPSRPDSPATPGNNAVDNVEQIILEQPSRGYYDLLVTHKDSLKDSLQHYSLLVEGMKEVFVAADSTFTDQNNGFIRVTNAPEYPPGRRFVWLVEPENQLPVTLTFTDFLTDTPDVVTVYDGAGNESPVLARFSGTLSNPDTLITSTSGSLYITFETGPEGGFPGFSSRYCTVAPDEEIRIEGMATPCHLDEEIYFFESLPQYDYFWELTENVAGSAILNHDDVHLVVPEDPFTLAVIPFNTCGTGERSERTVTPLTSPPNINQEITGDTVPCTNTPNLFSVESTTGTSYRWIVPEGWSGRSDSASIWVTPVKEPGILSVIPFNSCGEATPIELSLQPKSLPRIPVIESDRISPCENSVQEFFIGAEEEVSYRWETPAGWQIAGPDSLESVTMQIGTGAAGRVFLTASNKCGDTLTSRNFLLSPAPDPPRLQLQSSVIEGYREILVQNYSSYNRVEWLRNDSIIDFGGEFLVLHRNGIYSVEVTNSQGCTSRSEPSEWVEVDDPELTFHIAASEGGRIKIENDSNAAATLHAFDLTGRMVINDALPPGTSFYRTTRRGLLIFRISGRQDSRTQMLFIF